MIPDRPKIYHITHLRNLPQIVWAGELWSDAKRLALGSDCHLVGMAKIKRRRLEELSVSCHPHTRVGEYVPFYFCPRSVMLFILHRRNHPELTYRDGQEPIVHLQADLHETVRFAEQQHLRWAFSSSNAGTRYASFYNAIDRLGEINWRAVAATDFRDALIKDGKQAEFLIHESFPWTLVEKVGVANDAARRQVQAALASAAHRPSVRVEPNWYF